MTLELKFYVLPYALKTARRRFYHYHKVLVATNNDWIGVLAVGSFQNRFFTQNVCVKCKFIMHCTMSVVSCGYIIYEMGIPTLAMRA